MNVAAQNSVVRLLSPSDVDEGLVLTRAAGWNQLASDWQILMTLSREGCFALEFDGRLTATTTVICYGRELAWIGMVLTAREFRRRGFAELLMRKALEFVQGRGMATVKLDATEAGIKIYRKRGFVEECAIERWQRSPSSVDSAAVQLYVPDLEFDCRVFGADRSALLSLLPTAGAASLSGQGYAMGRPGYLAAYFGPCVARSADAAHTMLRWFLAQHAHENVFWDLLPDNSDAVCLAREFGFAPVRQLVRMRLSGQSASLPHSYKEQFAISGFEFG
jgi:GNAT superfamily N-acetyltransferase